MACNTPSIYKYLLIRSPSLSLLQDEFRIPQGFITQTLSPDNQYYYYLKFPVTPAEYTRMIEGEKPRYTDTFNRTFYSPRLARVGFRVASGYTDVKLLAFIEYVAKISASTTYDTYTAIQVIDYVRPEAEDIKNGIISDTEPFTVRYGMLNIDEGGGFMGLSNETRTNYYVDSGFGFSFMETNKRLIV